MNLLKSACRETYLSILENSAVKIWHMQGLMHEQDWPVGFADDGLGAAAEYKFVHARMTVGAHHQEIGFAFLGSGRESARYSGAIRPDDLRIGYRFIAGESPREIIYGLGAGLAGFSDAREYDALCIG